MFTIEQRPSVSIVRLHHPPVQAMNLEFCRELADALDNLEESGPAAVVLTGTDRVFSAGVDLKRLVAEPPDYIDEFLPALQRLFRTAWEFLPPLVVAVNGAALAGGCVLASCGDWRVLASEAPIGMPESRVGLPLPAEGIEIMRAVIGDRILPRIIGQGKKWTGAAAVEVGLADEVSPERISHLAGSSGIDATAEQASHDSTSPLVSIALDHARRLAEIAPAVFRLGKQQLRHAVSARIDEHHRRFGQQVQEQWKSERVRDAVRRFVAERLG